MRFIKNALISHGSFLLPMEETTSFFDIKILFYSDNLPQKERNQEAKKMKVTPNDILKIEELTVQDLIDVHQNLFAFILILRTFCQYKLGIWEFKKTRDKDEE